MPRRSSEPVLALPPDGRARRGSPATCRAASDGLEFSKVRRQDQRTATFLVVLLATGVCGAAELSAQLHTTDDWGSAAYPYLPARLHLELQEEGTRVQGLVVRCAEGGPFVAYQVHLSPGTPTEVRVLLPAFSPDQVYQVYLLDHPPAAGSVPKNPDATVTAEWPVAAVSGYSYLDPEVYEASVSDVEGWPPTVRRHLFMGSLLAALSGGVALLLRSRRLRAGACCLLMVVSIPVAIRWLSEQPLVHAELVTPRASGTGPGVRRSPLVLVNSRRSTVWTSGDQYLAPVYRDRAELRQDDTLVTPRGQIHVPVRPDRPRLFQQAGMPGG